MSALLYFIEVRSPNGEWVRLNPDSECGGGAWEYDSLATATVVVSPFFEGNHDRTRDPEVRRIVHVGR
jgi:hypothetical protein